MALPGNRILVIGGGITGLCCAHRLMSLGIEPTLVEASGRVGGRIRTLHEGGLEFEAGPNTLLDNSPALNALIDELGMRDRIVVASEVAKKRYVLLNGRLEALPMGPVSAFTSPLLGVPGVLGVLGDLFRARPADVPADESVASFIRRRFGARVLDRIVGPFLSGVYAGDPEQLEVRSVLPMLAEAEEARGSVIRGLIHRRKAARKPGAAKPPRPRGITFQGGLDRLPARIAESLGARVRLGASVAAIHENGDGCRVILADGASLTADRVVIATETSVAAGLVEHLPGGGSVAADLRAIPASDVAVVGLAYTRSQVAHPLDGFGYLVGPGNSGPMLGCLFRSSIFPASAPADTALLACFLGGAMHDIKADSDDRLMQIAQSELAAKLGAQGTPARRFVIRWPQALPQAVRGHSRRRARIEAWSRGEAGGGGGGGGGRGGRVSVICSGVYGAPLPKCIEAGRAEAQRLATVHSPVSTPTEQQACVPA